MKTNFCAMNRTATFLKIEIKETGSKTIQQKLNSRISQARLTTTKTLVESSAIRQAVWRIKANFLFLTSILTSSPNNQFQKLRYGLRNRITKDDFFSLLNI